MNPMGSMSLLFLRRYSDFVGNNHKITMPCIKTKLIAAKTYLKDQQTLNNSHVFLIYNKISLRAFIYIFIW
jgi:hypothetical protein